MLSRGGGSTVSTGGIRLRYFIKSTELSRMTPKTPGYVPSMVSPSRLRERARAGFGEFQSEQLMVQRLFRTKPETAEADRHVVLIDDVTRGLGLQQADEQRIQKAILDTNPSFSPKTQTQRLFHAQGRLSELLRSMKEVTSDARLEIAKRARSWWKKQYDTDLNRNRTVPGIQWGKSDAMKKADDMDAKIIEFFRNNPNPPDKKVHAFAKKLGIDEHRFEEMIYRLVTTFATNVGKHIDTPDSKFDKKQLAMGVKVEKEHTDNPTLAKEVAKDHLAEIADYYTRLKKMEAEGKGEVKKSLVYRSPQQRRLRLEWR